VKVAVGVRSAGASATVAAGVAVGARVEVGAGEGRGALTVAVAVGASGNASTGIAVSVGGADGSAMLCAGLQAVRVTITVSPNHLQAILAFMGISSSEKSANLKITCMANVTQTSVCAQAIIFIHSGVPQEHVNF